MKALYLIAVSALALGVAACQPAPKRLSKLDCPQSQGALTRVSAAADGRSCNYVGATGAEVNLRIVDVRGNPQAMLLALEQDLRSSVPAAVAAASQTPAGQPVAGQAAVAPGGAAAEAAAKASAEARADTGLGHGVTVKVDNDDDSSSETVNVDIPGLRIHADDANDRADIRIGGMEILADSDGAVMRQVRDVRLRGQSLSREKRGIRARLVIAGNVAPYSYLEYEVGGPKSGPVAVALVRAREGDGMTHDHDDVRRLVRRNGGV